MKEIENKESQTDKPNEIKTPDTLKETSDKKDRFGDTLDSCSSTDGSKHQDGNLAQTKTKEAQTDRTKISEAKANPKTPEAKKEAYASNLDNLSSTGSLKKTDNSENKRLEQTEGVKEITQPYYDNAEELAKTSEKGKNFTDHTEDHVEQVAEKSVEAANSLEAAIKHGNFQTENHSPDHIPFAGNVDKAALEGAALSHDTGMQGDGYAVFPYRDEDGRIQFKKDADGNIIVNKEDNEDFDQVRSNHSLNSAINVLANREKYKELGYTDEQVDMMAAECMAHSKTSSGVGNLNSRQDWGTCFDCMEAVKEQYNKDHPDAKIDFDRSRFENNDEKFGQLATSTLALRVGDVSRDSGPDAKSQSGDEVHVNRETINDGAGTPLGEVENADIKLGDEDMTNAFSRKIHAGEQNITDNRTYCTEDGTLCHEITIHDGTSAPECTIDAIDDHVKEFASGKGGKYQIHLKFDQPCSAETTENYRYYQTVCAAYKNVELVLPWDNKEDT